MPKRPQRIDDIKFDSYADTFTLHWRKGTVRLGFGQGVHTPPRMFVYIWLSLDDLKNLKQLIDENLPLIEKAAAKR